MPVLRCSCRSCAGARTQSFACSGMKLPINPWLRSFPANTPYNLAQLFIANAPIASEGEATMRLGLLRQLPRVAPFMNFCWVTLSQ